jgi:hypothetical protein
VPSVNSQDDVLKRIKRFNDAHQFDETPSI